MTKNIKTNITKEAMLEALSRSGYMLESEVAQILNKHGFFVEQNQVIIDQYTGKSREIDIIAEYCDWDDDIDLENISAGMIFASEVINNNNFPMVLISNFKPSPISNLAIEGLKEFITFPPKINYNYSSWEFSHEKMVPDFSSVFTQYCSFQKKKSGNKEPEELMAFHPDGVHDALQKVSYYCEDQLTKWIGWLKNNTEYFRYWISLPVLIIHKDLYELRGSKLKKVEQSILVHNYHFRGEPKTSYIFVVTKLGIKKFIRNIIDIRKRMVEEMKLILEKNGK